MDKNKIGIRPDQDQFEELIQGLLENDYGICDDFLNPQTIIGLRKKMLGLNANGEMKSAGLANKQFFQVNKLTRGDTIKWIEKGSEDEFEDIYLKKIDAFILYLNKTCYTSINEYESHYANYEQKSFYKRHLDQFKNSKERKYSVILYLNDAWLKTDGGKLSLYLAPGKQKDILPIGGKMVFFRSNLIEHEVHPSFTRDRMSISGWLKSS